MANIILFSHGQLATGLADSCKLIIGENHFKVLNILLDQNIQEIKNNLDVMIQSFDDNQPVIVVTDIPGGSTTQTAIQKISDNKLLYVVTGMNLGLVMGLSFLSLSQDDEDNKNKIINTIDILPSKYHLENGGKDLTLNPNFLNIHLAIIKLKKADIIIDTINIIGKIIKR